MASTGLWQQADEAWRRRDADAALRALDELLRVEPGHLDALNLSGFLRTTARPTEWDAGLAQLERALDLGTSDVRVLVNVVNALAARGRGGEALPRVRAWTERRPDDRAAWNTLGWLLGVVGDDLEGGRAALERAVRGHHWYGDARLNLGRLAVKQERWDDAIGQLTLAVQSRDCWRPHEAWTRLGELHAARGHLRRALGALRRAAERDDAHEYTAALVEQVGRLGHALHSRRRFVLHAVDEQHRNQALEDRRSGVPLDAPPEPLSSLAARARSLLETAALELRAALEAIIEQASERALLPRWSDQSPSFDLERLGGPAERALATDWRVALFDLYDELLDREEPAFDVHSQSGRAHMAAANRRWDEALLLLEPKTREAAEALGPDTIAALAERWGDRLVRLDDPVMADRCYSLAEAQQRVFASWATAGAEGLGRMSVVERVERKRSSKGAS
ncbi:MAG: tetratricopeptide repeat protein [Myxococcaceae bacterium]|nr:tetratricopeptide repeat protein [Myxococcaceae bacterium]